MNCDPSVLACLKEICKDLDNIQDKFFEASSPKGSLHALHSAAKSFVSWVRTGTASMVRPPHSVQVLQTSIPSFRHCR